MIVGQGYLGDFGNGGVVRIPWNTLDANGQSVTRTDGTLRIYKHAVIAESTAGITTVKDFDGLAGVHLITINLAADPNFFSSAADYFVVWVGQSPTGDPVNAILASFSINNRTGLKRSELIDVLEEQEVLLPWDTLYDAALEACSAVIKSALLQDRHDELSGVPTFPATLRDMIRWLFTLAAHAKDQTASTTRVFKADGETVLATKPVADDGSKFTDGPWQSEAAYLLTESGERVLTENFDSVLL